MNRLFYRVILGVLLCVATSFAVPANAKQALTDAAATGQFLFLTFYQASDASLTSLTKTVAAVKKSSTKKIALFNAVISDPVNKETADKYGIAAGQLPLVLVIAPNGVVTGGFPATVSADNLNQSLSVSDLMLKVLKPLQEQKIALVALQNASTKFSAESLAGVNDFVNDPQYSKFVTAIKVDPLATGGADFIKQCQLVSPISEATVVILMPPGKIGKVLTGKLTKADVLKALGSCATGCAPGSCSDRRFKQNISPITSSLDKTTKLQGVAFTWNTTDFPNRFFTNTPQIGLIAQDVEIVMPEVVNTDNNGFKSVEYDKLTALLIEAIKELNQKVIAQDSLIGIQNAKIQALEGK
jgi:hypothetical protein